MERAEAPSNDRSGSQSLDLSLSLEKCCVPGEMQRSWGAPPSSFWGTASERR